MPGLPTTWPLSTLSPTFTAAVAGAVATAGAVAATTVAVIKGRKAGATGLKAITEGYKIIGKGIANKAVAAKNAVVNFWNEKVAPKLVKAKEEVVETAQEVTQEVAQ